MLVEDDGPGLSSEQLGKAIQAGQRLDENSPGFGFGLSITRELAELYGGSLSLDRSSIGGLRVAIQLPPAAVNEDQQLGLKGRVEMLWGGDEAVAPSLLYRLTDGASHETERLEPIPRRLRPG